MSEPTPLDRLQAAIEAAPEDEAPRRAFWERLAASELHLLLAAEPEGDRAEPLVLETAAGRIALAFDTEERLAGFVDAPSPYLALSGRRLIAMLAGRDLALGLNLQVSDHPALLPPEALGWAAAELTGTPQDALAQATRVGPPEIAAGLLEALSARLDAVPGGFGEAWLARLDYREGDSATVLALTGVAELARPALAAALAEAHRLTGAGLFDVLYLDDGATVLPAFRRQGVGIEPAPPPAAPKRSPSDAPPRLR
ncbi:MAG: SseB family protein [Alphaproteobacteria bacterium]|nr:MAG: SseB family protein [Alphaproteobacteria bacterium]